MSRWVNIIEIIPPMSNHNPTNLILRHSTMNRETKRHQYPRQPRRFEDEQSKEGKLGIWVAPRPYVYEDAGECGAEEGYAEEWSEGEEAERGEGEEVGEFGWGAAGGFFEEAGVALCEEDVEDEVEREWTEVYEVRE
jgi:hypothetical protein